MNAFDNSNFEKYADEAKENWGETDAYNEYREKTKNYSKQNFQNLAESMDGIMAEFALCLKNGISADSAEVQTLVKTLQNHITENYYTCTNQILAGLGQMYVADERFKTNIDKNATGTAEFVSNAIEIYCK